ncbi:peptidoglycan-binding domain-containing protein [Krasilnikovia sp. M28-CT-15]|uniref:peptidoglycan-binding domain-containing protein n=1 Tax=Krasilnikovia sp. M28-CT-15 TaxID=3373540 RepID=UPI00399CE293
MAASAALTTGLLTGISPAAPAAAALPGCVDTGWAIGAEHRMQIQVPWDRNNHTNCTLQSGARNDGARALQRALHYCYHENIAVDGDFGDGTKRALRRVQGRLHVTADGVYGPQTRRKMLFASDIVDSFDACDKLGE